MARTYKRDSRGRFAGGGGGGGGRKGGAAKKGGRLGGKSSGPKMGAGRPGTSAPGGTVAKSAVNRSIGSVMGQGKGTRVKAKAAPSAFGGRSGKIGKSAKNTKARAKYKEAASTARDAAKTMAKRQARGTVDKMAKSYSKKAKSSLTRITNQLTARRAAATEKPKSARRRKR